MSGLFLLDFQKFYVLSGGLHRSSGLPRITYHVYVLCLHISDSSLLEVKKWTNLGNHDHVFALNLNLMYVALVGNLLSQAYIFIGTMEGPIFIFGSKGNTLTCPQTWMDNKPFLHLIVTCLGCL